ncbi:MAG: carbohydrate kinase family protein [Candidatus Bathyarchaeota archaeon]|nr:carbohydrate kinase family protein [Candidatus Bathyarchaeota archaeon]
MIDGIFFVGHVSIDKIQNVNGSSVQPGGAALYAAVAAKTLLENVYLISVVGRDYPFLNILDIFSRRYLRMSKAPSTRFNIKYDETWEAEYLEAKYGSGLNISPSLIPVESLSSESILHISPISPSKVKRIVELIREKKPKTKISVNAWIGYIRGENKRILREIAQEADFFILNDSEAKALTDTGSLTAALKILKSRMLIVTLGELGAIISRDDGEIQVVPALRVPIEKVIDTTGAGDTWCGSFLAAYKQTGDLMKSVIAASIISSIKCTGWGFSKLLNLKFRKVDDIIEYVIGLKEGGMQKKILDYIVKQE